MPLRDHFRPPVSKGSSWEGFYAMWLAYMVEQIMGTLPADLVAEPRVHKGRALDDTPAAAWNAPAPTLTVETEFPDEHAYEVVILDLDRDRELVAAIEIVSPANKEHPESRDLFAVKCVNLLTKGVCVSIVDLVTTRHFNLYVEFLNLKCRRDLAFGADASPIYAATCRKTTLKARSHLQTWAYPLVLGQPLPTLPVWIGHDQCVPLDLESSYEEACRTLKIW